MKSPRSPHSKAFTLIELLVVISIIAILATFSVGAARGVMIQAKKTSAKNDMMQLLTAVKSYYTEYGKYPIPTALAATVGDLTFGMANSNGPLLNILRAKDIVNNPRGIKFMDLALAKDQSNPRSGIVDATGEFVDPWGYQYLVFIDADYSGDLSLATTVATAFTGAVGQGSGTTIPISCGTASGGLYYFINNQISGTGVHTMPGARAYDKSYDLLSWQ
ncbi:MAG: prepilin-type N-terminal cleavage/methylation domain-containing protein [Verrucomicrobiota bacterium]